MELPTEDLPAIYNLADAFIYPSVYEGFGIPVLEAMAAGAPVLAANDTSLPEVVGGAGITLDGDNIREILEILDYLMSNSDSYIDLVVRGKARAKTFTWSAVASRVEVAMRDARFRRN